MQKANPEFQAAVESAPTTEEIEQVRQGLRDYNLRYAPADGYQPLNVLLRAVDGSVCGGLLGETYWGWLHIDILWVDDAARSQGYGSHLLELAEDEARRRGCHAIHLDTMSFQARPFYETHGYTVFGILNDLPAGHSRIFLEKVLI